MPLIQSSSKQALSANIGEMVKGWAPREAGRGRCLCNPTQGQGEGRAEKAMNGLAHPLSLPFLGRRVRLAPVRETNELTPDERDSIKAALVMETMEFENDKPREFADD